MIKIRLQPLPFHSEHTTQPKLVLTEGGFGVSQVAGLANFSPGVLGFTLKSCGFVGFGMYCGLRVWPFLVLGFQVFHSKLLFCWIFKGLS